MLYCTYNFVIFMSTNLSLDKLYIPITNYRLRGSRHRND
jgi:hypothetical protein